MTLVKRLKLTNRQRGELEKEVRSSKAKRIEVLRAKVILLLETGLNNSQVARKVKVDRHFVIRWKKRYLSTGLMGLQAVRKRREPAVQREKNLAAILKQEPRFFGIEEGRWTIPAICKAYQVQHNDSISRSHAWRIGRKLGVKFINKRERESVHHNQVEVPGRILSPLERDDLTEISRKWSLPYRQVLRAKIILLADLGLSFSEIGRRTGTERKIISKFVKRYSKERRLTYFSEKIQAKQQRHKEVQNQRMKNILAIVHDRPSSYGINRASWTCSALSAAYNKQYGEPIGKATVHRLMQQAGYSLRKARRVLTSPDPDYREKVELLLTTLRNLGEDEFLFFIDEMGPLRIKKYGGRTLMKKKEISTFPQNQADKGSIIMSAALNATKNQVTWFYSRAKDTQAMIDLIEILFNQYQNARRLYVTWDAASWHRSGQLVEWLDSFNLETILCGVGPTIHLIPLPTSAQFLDVIEAVFSGMKRAVIHHSDYFDKWEMKKAISRHFLERNLHFINNPKRAGEKIWDVDFFQDLENLKSGNYREW